MNFLNLKMKIILGIIFSYVLVILILCVINNKASNELKQTLLLNEAKLIAEAVKVSAATSMHAESMSQIVNDLGALDNVNNLMIADDNSKLVLMSNINKHENKSAFHQGNELALLLKNMDLHKRNSWKNVHNGLVYVSRFKGLSEDKNSLNPLLLIVSVNADNVTGIIDKRNQQLIYGALIGFLSAIFLILLLFKWQVSKPVSLLLAAINKVHKGHKKTQIEYKSKDEFGFLIAEFNHFNHELFENKLELEQQKALNEQAVKSKSDFLAVMSHEIRLPLNGIIGMSNLLNKTHLVGDQKIYAETIRLSGKQLLSIISDILDFSKIDSGKLTLDLQSCDLTKVVETTIDMFRETAEQSHITLITEFSHGLMHRVFLDEIRFKQILVNLLSNAFKFTTHGQVVVNVKIVDFDDSHYEIQVAVTDTGIGLRNDQLDKLFSEFIWPGTSTTQHCSGTGLGLAICKRLIDLMSGKIWIESELGEGASFIFELPLEKAELIENIPVTFTEETADFKPLDILLVEDMGTNQDIVKAILTGHRIEVANNGKEAIEQVTIRDHDIILMDCLMPEMDGFQATQAIRQLGIITPIIALTTSALQETKDKCTQAGMDDFLSKPFDEKEVILMVEKWGRVESL